MENVFRGLAWPFSIIHPPSSFYRRQPAVDFRQDQAARLFGGHLRVVDDLGPQGDHQRRRRPLAVALIARREILLHSVRRATARYMEVTEAAIRRNPAAWLWMHDRWRTRPEEQPGP